MFKRKVDTRKVEAKKHISSTSNYDIMGAKLGINRAGRNYDKIQFELNRNKHNLKQLGIDKSVLKQFGL